jgi:uncharacterized protein (TIGR02391 family)
MAREDVLRMVYRRAKAAGLDVHACCHTFRATGITAYLENGGTIEKQFHPAVLKHSRTHFYRSAYFHAVFEACKAFDASVRVSTQSERSAQPLMSEALSPGGTVKINSQQTNSERDEQQGVMYLCMGLMNAVRNPQAHGPELHWPMSREGALDVLCLISFLFRRLEARCGSDAWSRRSCANRPSLVRCGV